MDTPASVHSHLHIFSGTHCKGILSRHRCFPLLPHLHIWGSLYPKYRPGSPWLPIPPSLFKSYFASGVSFISFPRVALLAFPPLDSVFPTHTPREPCPSPFVMCNSSHGSSLSLSVLEERQQPWREPKNFSSLWVYIYIFTQNHVPALRAVPQASCPKTISGMGFPYHVIIIRRMTWSSTQTAWFSPLMSR